MSLKIQPIVTAALITLSLGMSGCQTLLDLFSTDTMIDVSCAGDDTVVIAGRDLCEEFEKTGKVDCDVGYRIRLDGQTVCPSPL